MLGKFSFLQLFPVALLESFCVMCKTETTVTSFHVSNERNSVSELAKVIAFTSSLKKIVCAR